MKKFDFLRVTGFRPADFLHQLTQPLVKKLVPQFQRHVSKLRFRVGNFPFLGDGLGDEAALQCRFVSIQKFRQAMPRPLLVRGEASVHDLPYERMCQPMDIQMSGDPRCKLLVHEQEFQQMQFQMRRTVPGFRFRFTRLIGISPPLQIRGRWPSAV